MSASPFKTRSLKLAQNILRSKLAPTWIESSTRTYKKALLMKEKKFYLDELFSSDTFDKPSRGKDYERIDREK